MMIEYQQTINETQQVKQIIETVQKGVEESAEDEKNSKDQALIKCEQQKGERSWSKLQRVLKSWSMQENILFLTFLVQNKEAFEEQVHRQKRKIFYLMAKKIKLRVSSMCCKRFYQLYALCQSSINGIIRRVSRYIEEERKTKEKDQIKDSSLKNLLQIHSAETDSECNRIISSYQKLLASESICEEIDYL